MGLGCSVRFQGLSDCYLRDLWQLSVTNRSTEGAPCPDRTWTQLLFDGRYDSTPDAPAEDLRDTFTENNRIGARRGAAGIASDSFLFIASGRGWASATKLGHLQDLWIIRLSDGFARLWDSGYKDIDKKGKYDGMGVWKTDGKNMYSGREGMAFVSVPDPTVGASPPDDRVLMLYGGYGNNPDNDGDGPYYLHGVYGFRVRDEAVKYYGTSKPTFGILPNLATSPDTFSTSNTAGSRAWASAWDGHIGGYSSMFVFGGRGPGNIAYRDVWALRADDIDEPFWCFVGGSMEPVPPGVTDTGIADSPILSTSNQIAAGWGFATSSSSPSIYSPPVVLFGGFRDHEVASEDIWIISGDGKSTARLWDEGSTGGDHFGSAFAFSVRLSSYEYAEDLLYVFGGEETGGGSGSVSDSEVVLRIGWHTCDGIPADQEESVCNGVGICLLSGNCDCEESSRSYGLLCDEVVGTQAVVLPDENAGDDDDDDDDDDAPPLVLLLPYRAPISYVAGAIGTFFDCSDFVVLPEKSDEESLSCVWKLSGLFTSDLKIIIPPNKRAFGLENGSTIFVRPSLSVPEEALLDLTVLYNDWKPEDGDLNQWGTAVGIIIGFIVAVLLLSVCILISCCVRWRYRKARRGERVTRQRAPSLTSAVLGERPRSQSDSNEARFSVDLDMFVIRPDEIRLTELIGSGGSGASVFLGSWRQKEVAVKVFKLTASSSGEYDFAMFENEAKFLASATHPNIGLSLEKKYNFGLTFTVTLYGVCLSVPRVCFVFEYCNKGDLRCVFYTLGAGRDFLSPEDKLRVLAGISSALEFLHRRGIMHRDIKADNVLMDHLMQPKLTDFGTCKKTLSSSNTVRVGTTAYMAPEVTLGQSYSFPCDVFSLSILSYEILAGDFDPYKKRARAQSGMDSNYETGLDFRVANDHSYRPVFDGECIGTYGSSLLIRTIQLGWSSDPNERPTVHEFLECVVLQMDCRCFGGDGQLRQKTNEGDKNVADELFEEPDFDKLLSSLPDFSVKVMDDEVEVEEEEEKVMMMVKDNEDDLLVIEGEGDEREEEQEEQDEEEEEKMEGGEEEQEEDREEDREEQEEHHQEEEKLEVGEEEQEEHQEEGKLEEQEEEEEEKLEEPEEQEEQKLEEGEEEEKLEEEEQDDEEEEVNKVVVAVMVVEEEEEVGVGQCSATASVSAANWKKFPSPEAIEIAADVELVVVDE